MFELNIEYFITQVLELQGQVERARSEQTDMQSAAEHRLWQQAAEERAEAVRREVRDHMRRCAELKDEVYRWQQLCEALKTQLSLLKANQHSAPNAQRV